ncbi:hypothetical protein JS562_12185 [Agrobacterium sp. S2]|nr:hypothetical protein [Agrobacterium sp. S2]
MTTIISTSTHGIAHQGNLYVATLKTGCALSTDPEELIRTIQKHEEAKHEEVFSDVVTWTFVRSDHAAHYDTWLSLKSNMTVQLPNTTLGHLMRNTPFGTFSQEVKDAAEWIAQNAKSRVHAWVIPGTDLWYWIFEDAQEAVVFRLAVTL